MPDWRFLRERSSRRSRILTRQRLSKYMRHVRVKHWFAQALEKERYINITYVHTCDNLSDWSSGSCSFRTLLGNSAECNSTKGERSVNIVGLWYMRESAVVKHHQASSRRDDDAGMMAALCMLRSILMFVFGAVAPTLMNEEVTGKRC